MSSLFQSPEVRVVEASAGSGKTYALAMRYVQLLLYTDLTAPLSLKHILAITFTNKAAAEMKARIIDLLKRIALGKLTPPQELEILKPLGLAPEAAAKRAGVLMAEVIEHYHYFQVQTIDSFMNALLAGCAFKINLSARFKIKRNAFDYLQLSLDQLIDEAASHEDIKVLFERFIRQYLFLENRSGWFPKKDLLAVLNVLFNLQNTYQQPLLTFDQGRDNAAVLKKRFLEMAGVLKTTLPLGIDQRFAKGLNNFMAAHPQGFDIDDVSRYFVREEMPVKKAMAISDEMESLWQDMRQTLRAICLQESYAVFNPYVDLFEAAMGHLGRLQNKDDILFLQQLNKKTSELFDDALVTVEELYFRLATRFRHYLVDEFQDTSAAQWRNLRMMVEEGLSTGGTLFYVGDKKQAIYSFRGGHSQLFDDLQTDLANFNVTRETLTTNYRSHKAIVDFNNCVFHLDNLTSFLNVLEKQDSFVDKDMAFNDDDRDKLANVFGNARQIPRADLGHGAVRVEVILGRKKEDRSAMIREKVINLVKSAHGRFNYRDMAILTRNNAEVQMVTHWLVREGIYVQSDRTSDLKNHPLIMELFAFLRFLHSPIDNAAFAEFLLGGLFARSTGISSSEIQKFLFAHRGQYLYKAFHAAYPDIWQDFFEDFIAKVGVYPLYEIVVTFSARWQCAEIFPDAQGFIMHFLELVKRKEEDSCDLETFIDYFETMEDEERFVPTLAQEAVRVLTIHKSKGLEFPLVIIPFLEMSIKAGSSDKNGSQSFTWDMDAEGMRLLRLKESYTRFSPELKARYAHEYKASFFAELNSVYVALTRPVLEMHVFIPERVGNSVNPLPLLIPQEFYSLGDVFKPTAPRHTEIPRSFLPALKYREWVTSLAQEFLWEGAAQSRVRIDGEIVHFCLAQVGDLSTGKIADAVEHALARATVKFAHVKAWHPYQEKIWGLLQRPDWRPFFYLKPGAVVLCEQEIVNRFGDSKRLDRLIIFPNEVWVIDFKSSQGEQEAHQKQIEGYKELLAILYPGCSIKGYLLYLDSLPPVGMAREGV